jgi:hypothetical protein
MREGTNILPVYGISAYFNYMRVADSIDSQKSEDHNITDKLP